MKTFEIIENHFANIGLTASPSRRPNRFNTKNVISLILIGVFILSSSAYLVLTANDFADYITSLYGCSMSICFFIAFANFILQTPNRKICHFSWARDFSKLLNIMNTMLFVWVTIAVCSTMLILQMELVKCQYSTASIGFNTFNQAFFRNNILASNFSPYL